MRTVAVVIGMVFCKMWWDYLFMLHHWFYWFLALEFFERLFCLLGFNSRVMDLFWLTLCFSSHVHAFALQWISFYSSTYLALSEQFNWHAIPEHEKKRRQHTADPAYSPTMAGGLFSIDREFFKKLGTYDDGFDIWGGENLELSFKVSLLSTFNVLSPLSKSVISLDVDVWWNVGNHSVQPCGSHLPQTVALQMANWS